MNKRFLLVSIITVITFFSAAAQITDAEKSLKTVVTDTVKGWKHGGFTSVNLSQTALVNWAAGGESSVAINGLFSAFANYKNSKTAWDNSLDLGYGMLNQSITGFRKTDDKIDFTSKYGQKAFKDFYYAALFNFKTQFTVGRNYITKDSAVKISNFFAPAYLLGAVGLNYQPNSYFNAFLAPFTGKLTLVCDTVLSNQGAFGVEKGKTLKSEFGGYARMILSKNDFKSELLKNVSFTTKLDLFSNYLDNPQYVDVNWEALIGLKVNKYISVSINTQLVYDYDVKFAVLNADGTPLQKSKIQFK
ncbi:MAG: DUF3078 domain-containing protein, partial [Paludibacter sp.]|nr:DUF3078 domain-containing protein [Paludibacter sp.]